METQVCIEAYNGKAYTFHCNTFWNKIVLVLSRILNKEGVEAAG